MSFSPTHRASLAIALLTTLLQGCALPPLVIGFTAQTYVALGDSITYGSTLASHRTQAYPALVAAHLNQEVLNLGIPGDRACGVFPRQLIPSALGFGAVSPKRISLMIGTNDVNTSGPGPYEALFKTCHSAVITWVGTLNADKLLPGSAQVQASGGCSSVAGDTYFTCPTPGSLVVPSLITTGNAVYIWYQISNVANPSATLTVTLDTVSTAVAAKPSVDLQTANGTPASIALIRLPTLAGPHSLRITAANGSVSILGIGSNRVTKPIPVAVGDLPNQLLTAPLSPVADQLEYSADIQADIADAVADNLDIRFVPDRKYMLGTAAELSDAVHPNALGHQHLAQAFETVFP